jgi:hypothetical protein
VIGERFIEKKGEVVMACFNVSLAGADENHKESQDSQFG